ncbi:hypothetical protein EW146_g3152 [Bondarzewia mesenterica]|uniref:Uncharacterized protein n=1 Tax=Bondarzewia mesenterica TaxID=1095465 RepID=A0A4S4M4D1_9AGAM|nr:hypothetical protein EW146_g3152 [Bondarzewia mesenterica]
MGNKMGNEMSNGKQANSSYLNISPSAELSQNIPLYVLTTQLNFLACDLLAVEISNQIIEALLKLSHVVEKAKPVMMPVKDAEREENSELHNILSKFNFQECFEAATTDTEMTIEITDYGDADTSSTEHGPAIFISPQLTLLMATTTDMSAAKVSVSSLKSIDLEQEVRDDKEDDKEDDKDDDKKESVREDMPEMTIL